MYNNVISIVLHFTDFSFSGLFYIMFIAITYTYTYYLLIVFTLCIYIYMYIYIYEGENSFCVTNKKKKRTLKDVQT